MASARKFKRRSIKSRILLERRNKLFIDDFQQSDEIVGKVPKLELYKVLT